MPAFQLEQNTAVDLDWNNGGQDSGCNGGGSGVWVLRLKCVLTCLGECALRVLPANGGSLWKLLPSMPRTSRCKTEADNKRTQEAEEEEEEEWKE